MSDKGEPIRWITVKGKHIPVYRDEHGQDVFGNGREEYKSTDDMVKRVVGENNTYFSSTRKEAVQNVTELKHKINDIDTQLKELNEQLKSEKHLSAEDEKMLRDAGMYKEYAFLWTKPTAKGKEIEKQIKELEQRQSKIKEERNYRETILDNLNKKQLQEEKNEWLERISNHSTMKEPTKKDYAGFKLNESTTRRVDDALKAGQAKVVEMSPMEYLERVNYEIFTQFSLSQNIAGRSYKDVNKYAEMMRRGVKFDTPYLDYENEGQEGIHRALAAIQNGYEKIPVIVRPKRR